MKYAYINVVVGIKFPVENEEQAKELASSIAFEKKLPRGAVMSFDTLDIQRDTLSLDVEES
jgi:hypothetical protein